MESGPPLGIEGYQALSDWGKAQERAVFPPTRNHAGYEGMNAFSRVLWAAVAIAAAGAAGAREQDGDALDDASYPSQGGYAISIDNDLFSGAHRDEDYSWGGAVTYASPRPGPLLAPL